MCLLLHLSQRNDLLFCEHESLQEGLGFTVWSACVLVVWSYSGPRERSWSLQDGKLFSEMSWVPFGQPVLKSLKSPLEDGLENPTDRRVWDVLGCSRDGGDIPFKERR